MRAEQTCLQAVRTSEREVRDILQARQAEEADVALNVSVFDTTRNQVGQFQLSSVLLPQVTDSQILDAYRRRKNGLFS